MEGLDALSASRLAGETGVSKAGVFSLFGSKESLQLAAIEWASDIFRRAVVEPALAVGPGIAQLWALVDHWVRYARSGVFPGGCFFLTVEVEYAGRTGAVHDAAVNARRSWLEVYESAIATAQQLGEIAPEEDPPQLAFELDAFALAANIRARLFDEPDAFDRALEAMRARLANAAITQDDFP